MHIHVQTNMPPIQQQKFEILSLQGYCSGINRFINKPIISFHRCINSLSHATYIYIYIIIYKKIYINKQLFILGYDLQKYAFPHPLMFGVGLAPMTLPYLSYIVQGKYLSTFSIFLD